MHIIIKHVWFHPTIKINYIPMKIAGFSSLWLFFIILSLGSSCDRDPVLDPEDFRHYIDSFNLNDAEVYRNEITNDESWEFISGNIPLFDCPDKQMEQTYYFRWWTFRKHIKNTPDGYVVTEFLPDVPWGGKYNTINCAASFHFYEGRWMHDQKYLNDYARFWFRGGGSIRKYSCWISDALYNHFLVTGDQTLIVDLFPDMISNYEAWENEKLDSNGLFWQFDGYDGMELSICGSGYRATINSYMYAEAEAVSEIAGLTGNDEVSERFLKKALTIKDNIQNMLWDDNDSFFKVLPREDQGELCKTRELHGYTPWYFNIPDSVYSEAWRFLMDTAYFFASYGLVTAERSDSEFKISYEGHECQWNGPSWPYSTSVTLTGLANLLNNYSQDYITRKDYFKLLGIYSDSHKLKREDGKTVPWIDENLNPFTGDWIARTRLKKWENGTWSREKGGVERGKDYNHSTFCDLLITGLIGLRPQSGNKLIINPLIPEDTWDYFCLDNILYHGKILTIVYDKTGKRYKKGRGLRVWVDGKPAAASPDLKRLVVSIS